MNKKHGVAIGVPVTVLLAVLGANWDVVIDTSTTTISDSFNTQINNYLTENNIDVEEFKKQCDDGIHEGTSIEPLCRLV